MAKRRHQSPTPFRDGGYWWIRPWIDVFVEGKLQRKQKRVKLAPDTVNQREVLKIRDEYLRPVNQSLESIGEATTFTNYVNDTYIPVVLPLMAKTTQDRYRGIIANYLLAVFGKFCLRELGSLQLQKYFSAMADSNLSSESRDKVRDVLSSILGSAVRYQLLVKNPIEGVQLPPSRKGKRVSKPTITSEQFDHILAAIAEPY